MSPEIIAIAERSYDAVPRDDVHDFWQLVLPVAGSLDMRVGERRGFVDRDHFAALAPGTGHLYHSRGDNRFLVVDLSLPGGRDEGPALRPMTPRMTWLVGLLRAERSAGGFSDPAIRSALGGYISAALVADAGELRHPAPTPAHAIASRARALIESDPARAWSIDELAYATCTSTRHLARCFQAACGMSPSRYIRAVRLAEAKRLLRDGAVSAGEAAVRTGFPSQSHFTRAFAAEFGVTPGAWRRGNTSGSGNTLSGTGKAGGDAE